MESEQEKSQQLDRRVPFAFYVAGQIVLGLGDAIKDYPIASGAIILGQALVFGVELNELARGIPIDTQLSLILHIGALRMSVVAGAIGEIGYRLIKPSIRIEGD